MARFSYLLTFTLLFFAASCNSAGGDASKSATSAPTDSTATSKPAASKKDTVTGTRFHSRQEIAETILITSPRVRALTSGLAERIKKNGGTSWGTQLEGSPDPDKDTAQAKSATYDYNLHESYPDRMLVTHRFSFDPVKRQLYEYDTANDSLIKIDFDKSLLKDFDEMK